MSERAEPYFRTLAPCYLPAHLFACARASHVYTLDADTDFPRSLLPVELLEQLLADGKVIPVSPERQAEYDADAARSARA